MAAEAYQQSSATVQMECGKMFIRTDVLPQPGDAILDLGCGTGELSTYFAELVGPQGYVIAVDPDKSRLKLATEAHSQVKNLSFVEGNSDSFEGMGSEKYDIIFSNHAFQWMPNKKRVFRNMFNSLKAGGKIAIQYIDALSPSLATAVKVLNPEKEEQFNNMFHFMTRNDVDRLCVAAGFDAVRSYYTNDLTVVYPSMDSLLQWFFGTSNGVFDLQLVTQERIELLLAKFGNPPFDFSADTFDSRLIAVKPQSQPL